MFCKYLDENKAAVEGYQNRLAYLDMATKYKDIMKGKQDFSLF